MASSKSKGIPSWQKSVNTDTPTSPLQNDDPVYSQQEAAEASPALQKNDESEQDEGQQAAIENVDDPVYAQATAAAASPTPSSDSSSSTQPSSSDLQSRSSLLDSASKFLQHEDLRTASLDRKVAFLQGKGLTKEEIDGLLDFPASVAPANVSTTQSNQTPAPPIITYPEFLLHAHRPKPLVTRTRIINAVYATGLISGALYLANRYLFEPMSEQMTIARHELFETAQQGVDKLNSKLEDTVSVIPPAKEAISEEVEVDSVASDPTELFHRDIGVQTSPKLEGEGEKGDTVVVGDDAAEKHASQLQQLKDHIESLSNTGKDALEEDEATRSIVGDLHAYLEELAYGGRKPAFSWENAYGGDSTKADSGKMDEIAKFKAEIRSLKGALLSARNFPSGSSGSLRVR